MKLVVLGDIGVGKTSLIRRWETLGELYSCCPGTSRMSMCPTTGSL